MIVDKGRKFVGLIIMKFCEDLNTMLHIPSISHPQVNGQIEITNRTIISAIKTRLERSLSTCTEERNLFHRLAKLIQESQLETSFSLTYGVEVVIPIRLDSKITRSYPIRKIKT